MATHPLRAALDRAHDHRAAADDFEALLTLLDAVEEHLAQLKEVTQHGYLMLPSPGFPWPEKGRVLFKRPRWSSRDEVVATRTRFEYVSDWEYSVDPATIPGDVKYGPRGTVR